MATKTWTGQTSNDWFTAGNWSPSGVPASGDDVVIPTTTTGPLLDASTTVNSVTISGTTSLSLSPSANTTLTVTTAFTLSSTGGITGTGTVFMGQNATFTVTGASTITASGGQLAIFAQIVDSGNQLTLKINGNTDSLSIIAGNATVHAVNFNGASGTLNVENTDLTVVTAIAIGAGTLNVVGGALIDASGVTISTGTITGTGTVTAAVTATGAAHIATRQFGGLLEIAGPVTDNGNALTLTITDSNGVLILDAASTAHAVSFNGAGGTLELNNSSLTVNTQLAVGSGQLFLGGNPGSVLTAASGVTVSTGTISGAGKLAAAVTATGAANIHGQGLTLEITGPITDSGGALTLTTELGTLLLDATSAAHAVSFISNGTLELRNALTVGTAMAIGGGQVKLDNANSSLTDLAGMTLNGGLITGLGIVTGALSGGGTVRASGGLLELVTAIGNSTGTFYDIGNAAADGLAADGKVGTGNDFTFLGANGALFLANDSGFNSTLSGLNVGAGGAETNFVDVEGHVVTVSTVTGQGTTSGTITLSDGAVLELTNISSPNWNAHTLSDGSTGGTDVFLSDAPCFCRGTLILTEHGEVPVEALAVGDRVRTLSGGLKPVMWIGFGRELVTRRNSLARPIIVRRGALADCVPARDLYLTHGHALYLDNVLIPVENLVNHRSILWDEAARVVEFYHLELAEHDVLLADGAPAESYYDAGNRALFHHARPGSAPGAAKPTYAPVLNGGAVVEAVWNRLFLRSGGSLAADTTDDPDPHLVVDGRRLDPAAAAGGVYSFLLAEPPAAALHLGSRSGAPSLLGVSAHDHRRLGIAIGRIVISQPGIATVIEPDAPLLVEGGCHPAEGGYAWTDGELALPARLFAHLTGAFTLAVHIERPGMRYPLSRAVADAA